MVVNRNAAMKRVKRRRVTADLFDFLTFPASEVAAAPFRVAVREFLKSHCTLPPPSTLFPHLLTWQMMFRVGESEDVGKSVVCVDVVEEDVARSKNLYCDQCRVVGWSDNPVCTKRYHFIIKANGHSIGGYQKSCARCSEDIHMSEARCSSCSHVMTAEDVENWVYQQLEDTTHLLHGVIHANGLGHLLRVNGREGGSTLLSGSQIMNFWDRLCKVLGVRKISVMDVSKKYGLEFRLLHALIKGHSWYGDWGYEFGSGSFGLTHNAYKSAVDNLSSIPLDVFYSRGRTPRSRVHDLILFYRSLSERELVNIRDLFSFLLCSIHDVRKSYSKAGNKTSKMFRYCNSEVPSAWTNSDISRVEAAVFRMLRAVKGDQWVGLRALKGAIYQVGPPGLLDYCLKELKGKKAADGLVFNARCNPDSGAIELRLEATSTSQDVNMSLTGPGRYYLSEEHLVRDLKYLFGAMFHPRSMLSHHVTCVKKELVVSSASTLVDCKQFMKDYNPDEFLLLSKSQTVHLLCDVDAMENPDVRVMNLQPEVLILPSDATIADVKLEAARAFQEVYVIFKKFIAEELVGYGGVDESTQVKLLIGSVGSVRVKGRCLGKNLSKYRMERGLDKWTVDCSCGAKDDDGERMLACDVCGVWQHTRCAGIPDHESEPMSFICGVCRYSAALPGACSLSEDMAASLQRRS